MAGSRVLFASDCLGGCLVPPGCPAIWVSRQSWAVARRGGSEVKLHNVSGGMWPLGPTDFKITGQAHLALRNVGAG